MLLIVPTARGRGQAAAADSLKPRPLRVWVAGGLGSSAFYGESGIAIRSSASVSYSRFVLTWRSLDAFDGIDGYLSTDARSGLVGYRMGRRHVYSIVALGFAKTVWKDGHGYCAAPCEYRSEDSGLAYDFGFHATRMLGGLAINFSGVAGPPQARISSLVLSPQLGWFGK